MEGIYSQIEEELISENPEKKIIAEQKGKNDAILIFLSFVQQTKNSEAKKRGIQIIHELLPIKWTTLSNEQKNQVHIQYLQFIQDNHEEKELLLLSDGIKIIFTQGEFWTDIIDVISSAYQTSKFELNVILLSKVIKQFPSDMIISSYEIFRNMAYNGLSSKSFIIFSKAIKIFFYIAQTLNRADILKPVVTSLEAEAETAFLQPQENFEVIWNFIGRLVSFPEFPMDEITTFLKLAIDTVSNCQLPTENRLHVLNSFLTIIYMFDPNIIKLLIDISLTLALQFTQTEHLFAIKYMSVVESVVIPNPNMVSILKEYVQKYVDGDSDHIIVGLSLLKSLMLVGESEMMKELPFIESVIDKTLKKNDTIIKDALIAFADGLNDGSFHNLFLKIQSVQSTN